MDDVLTALPLTDAALDAVIRAAAEEARRRVGQGQGGGDGAGFRLYTEYQDDPVGFTRDVLGTEVTADIERLMLSVRDNTVTIAKSANAVGKCVAYGETLVLADGTPVKAEDLIGRAFDVHSVDEHLNVRVSRAYATDNGVRPVVRITTASGKSIVRTTNHPLVSASSWFKNGRTPQIGAPEWVQAGSLKPGDVILTVRRSPVQGQARVPDGFAWEKIASVDLLAPMPTVAVTVPGDETFLTDFVEHNTHAAAHVALWFWSVFPGAQVYTAAAPPERNLRQLLWGEIGKIVHRHPEVIGNRKLTATLHIERSPGEFITGVTIPQAGTEAEREARFSGKHAPYMLFIVDEADAVPDAVYRGIESCMSGGHVRLLCMFNPRAKAGPVYRMERNRQANVVTISALTHPNVTTGLDVIPGAVSREITVRRINEWSRALLPGEARTDHCFEVPDYLVGAVARRKDGTLYPPLPGGWRKIENPQLSYMTLADYPAQAENQLVNEEDIFMARTRWDAYVALHGETPPTGTRAVMGLDVAELGMDQNVACLRYGGYVARLESWGGVDVLVTGDKAAAIYLDHEQEILRVNVDATGVGAGVAPQIVRTLRAKRRTVRRGTVQGVKTATKPTAVSEDGEFALLRDQLWWAVREWLRTDPGAMLPPDEDLIEELMVPTYQVKNGRITVMAKDDMREKLHRSPDRADALALTFAPQNNRFSIGFAGFGKRD